MGSKFVEKHKRKSVLAALLFIFQGRVKYVSIALMLLILSVPFVISGETLGRILELRPVAAFLRTVGLGSVVSVINPKYSNDMLRAAMDKAAEDSAQNSFWAKFLKSINATLPPGGAQDSLAMLRGGKADIFGPLTINEGKDGKRGPGQVKGAVNDEERERGETGDEVNFEGLMAGGPGGAGGPGAGGDGSGLYGDLMGQNMSGSFGAGGSGSGSGPYIDRSRMGAGGAGGRSSGMYSKVMGQSASKVPVPGSPSKVNTKKMGRVSGFSWKNVGYKTSNSKMNVQLNSKKPMFQLAQTFAMTDAAYRSKDSAYEYQAAYVGTTYDGNDSNMDVMQTDADAVTVPPDTSFTGDIMGDVQGLSEQAKKCTDAQGTHGAAMSSDGKQMKDIGESMGKPPSCCSSGVGRWNGKIDRVMALCADFNSHEAALSAACQNTSSPMDCGRYSKYKIKPCSKLRCFLAFLLALLFSAILLSIGLVSMLFGGDFLGPIKYFFNVVAGGKAMKVDEKDKADYEKATGKRYD